MFTEIRLSVDQTLENATGVGAPSWTWPRDELAIDILHKAGYAFALAISDIRSRTVARARRPAGR
jgi:hypothetical protein